MAEEDYPFDFESEDPTINSSVLTKKRKKVIGLDELLADFYKEKSKVVEKESKRAKGTKRKILHEEQDSKEASLAKLMKEMSGEEENSQWGIHLFQDQNSPPSPVSALKSCGLLKSFMNNELNSLVKLSSENGGSFIEGLLESGWLSKLLLTCGHVEESIAAWTFNLVLYSSKEKLRTSACDFWCAILSSEKELIKIDWFPSYSELRKALEVYGFLCLPNTGAANAHSSCRGPAQNIRSWIKFVTASCQVRSKWSVFSTSEAEELVEVIICFFLDRQLQGLSVLLYECTQAVINYFTDKEWEASCEKIAKSLACRVPKDLNCIRIVECISGVNDRSKHLRSAVAYQILIGFFDYKAAHDEVLRLLIAISLKDKNCDLFKMYIYLVLTENWLSSKKLLEDNPVLKEMYGLYLRNCSCQISSTDLRSFASKVFGRMHVVRSLVTNLMNFYMNVLWMRILWSLVILFRVASTYCSFILGNLCRPFWSCFAVRIFCLSTSKVIGTWCLPGSWVMAVF
ncbi:actin protein 2/3 complex subunit-like protein [Trema orientale]|uniref:Actin protein 2/3 complex subunit-like protein n=1 Tax=Trema orientale TaxID=63057 RepID=A0A2P5FTM3_TREOI|nr:actin protein 2/3 complex subunit-like protein [Trema orientale]